MVVNSISFLLFFAVVFIVYYLLKGKDGKKTKSMAACCQLLFLRVY